RARSRDEPHPGRAVLCDLARVRLAVVLQHANPIGARRRRGTGPPQRALTLPPSRVGQRNELAGSRGSPSFMTPTEDAMRYRSRVFALAMFVAVMLVAGPLLADETCNSPYLTRLIKGQEDYVHVWTLGVDGMGDGSDKLVTIGANPKAANYGKV